MYIPLKAHGAVIPCAIINKSFSAELLQTIIFC